MVSLQRFALNGPVLSLLLLLLSILAHSATAFWKKEPSSSSFRLGTRIFGRRNYHLFAAVTATHEDECLFGISWRGGSDSNSSHGDESSDNEQEPTRIPQQQQRQQQNPMKKTPVQDEPSDILQEEEMEEDEWEDAREEEEGEVEGWTEEDGARLHQMEVEGWFDDDDEEEEEDYDSGEEMGDLVDEHFEMKESGEQQQYPEEAVPLTAVWNDPQTEATQQQKEEIDDEFLEAREDPFDGVTAAGSSVHTDDDSSAFVDRMELADAYDEGLLEEEEPAGTPVLAMGGQDEHDYHHDNLQSNDIRGILSAQDISPGGGTDDDSEEGVNNKEQDSDKGGIVSEEEAHEATDATVTNNNNNDVEAVPNEITNDMEQVLLKDLHWKRYEVQAMRPDIAAVVVHKKLRRPQEGMPVQWYTNGSKVPSSRAKLVGKVLKGAIPVVLGAAALYAGRDMSLDNYGKRLPKLKTPAFWKRGSVREEFIPPDTEPTVEERTDAYESEPAISSNSEPGFSDEDATRESLNPEDEVVEHSDWAPTKQVAQQQSWLDELISKLEKAIKGIFSKEL